MWGVFMELLILNYANVHSLEKGGMCMHALSRCHTHLLSSGGNMMSMLDSKREISNSIGTLGIITP
jgi:hypothetical protein